MSFVGIMFPDIEVEYQDKRYTFSPLNFKLIAEYIIWYQYRELDIAKETTKGLPESLRNKILEETYERCRAKKWIEKDENGTVIFEKPFAYDTPEILKSFDTPEGIAQQAYLCLKNNHPEMTYDLANRICKLATYEEIVNKIKTASGLTPDDNMGESSPNQ